MGLPYAVFRSVEGRGASWVGGADRPVPPVRELLNTSFETWGTAMTAEKLKAHLDDGGCALIVLVERPEIERRFSKYCSPIRSTRCTNMT
jgi:hypothetical protein